ncbi:MAG: helix-turn-helix domain-containing protein [Clostridiaceae bacterium]|nr:helix-turn-helix domain-containing protein [Clostridiaceae bacterium]
MAPFRHYGGLCHHPKVSNLFLDPGNTNENFSWAKIRKGISTNQEKQEREVPGSRNTSLSKSLNILDCFIGNNQTRLSLSDIQGMTQIPVSTCYRLIDFLEQSGYLTKSKKDKHYSLGWKLLLLGIASAGTNRELFLRELAPPYMRLLRDCFNERFPFLFG